MGIDWTARARALWETIDARDTSGTACEREVAAIASALAAARAEAIEEAVTGAIVPLVRREEANRADALNHGATRAAEIALARIRALDEACRAIRALAKGGAR